MDQNAWRAQYLGQVVSFPVRLPAPRREEQSGGIDLLEDIDWV